MKHFSFCTQLTILPLGLLLCLFLTACGKNTTTEKKVPGPLSEFAQEQIKTFETDKKTLVTLPMADLNTFTGNSSSGLSVAPLWQAVFGGTSGHDVNTYFNQRIKIAIPKEKYANATYSMTKRLQPEWLLDPDKSPSLLTQSSFSQQPVRGSIVAINVGAQFGLAAKINQTTLRLHLSNSFIDIASTRSGIIVLDKYREGFYHDAKNNISFFFPKEFRLATLVHEARHSDCTGGINPSLRDIIYKSKSYHELLSQMPSGQLNCTHSHATCPPGHALAGVDGCDKDVWGPYGIQSIYLMGLLKDRFLRKQEIKSLQPYLSDALSRLPINFIEKWKTTSPDMSHQE